MTRDDTTPAIIVVDPVAAGLDWDALLPDGAVVERVAGTAAAAAVRGDETAFDCAVVTGSEPDGSWRRVLADLRGTDPSLPVVLVTPAGSERLAAAAVDAGVAGYVNATAADAAARLAAAVADAVGAPRLLDAGRLPADAARTIVEHAGDPMYLLDAAGELRLANEAMAERVGVDVAALLGSDVERFVTAESVAAVEAALARVLSTGATHDTVELDLVTADGDLVPCEASVAPVRDADGVFAGSVGVVRDITERKRRAEALERQNERLERFAGVVSHDLRNPMEVARGRLDLARETGEDRHLDRVDDALERMETIVDDLLALARQGETVRDTRPTPLDRTARAAWEVVDTGDAALTVTTDRRVSADRSRLQQLFENLFRNAVEHGSTGRSAAGTRPPVSVRVGLVYRGEGVPDGFYVADDGPGIPADRRDAVFDYGTSGTEDGTGLGLAIVKDVVDAHGWRIRVADGQWSENGGADGPTRRSDGSGDPPGTGARFEITGVTVCE